MSEEADKGVYACMEVMNALENLLEDAGSMLTEADQSTLREDFRHYQSVGVRLGEHSEKIMTRKRAANISERELG